MDLNIVSASVEPDFHYRSSRLFFIFILLIMYFTTYTQKKALLTTWV